MKAVLACSLPATSTLSLFLIERHLSLEKWNVISGNVLDITLHRDGSELSTAFFFFFFFFF